MTNQTRCDAKPLDKEDIKNLKKLWHQYNQLLHKDIEFHDIEKWTGPKTRPNHRVSFIRGHVRWSNFKTKDNFIRKSSETEEYFRAIGLYAHHGPLPEKYKGIFIKYSEIGMLQQAITAAGSTANRCVVERYISRNLKKILAFVASLDTYEL